MALKTYNKISKKFLRSKSHIKSVSALQSRRYAHRLLKNRNLPLTEAGDIKRGYIPSEEKNIKIHGRTVSGNPLPLFWHGSGIEVNADGSELLFEIVSGFSTHEQWVRIEVNGFTMLRAPLKNGLNTVYAYRGMVNTDKIKNVRLIKEVQPMNADPKSFIAVNSVMTDGTLYPVRDRKYKIEFVGDSITSGEGLSGPAGLNEWIPMIFTTENNYAVKTAEMLDADYRLISQSGWGTYCSWDNNLTHTLPCIYEKVCGSLTGQISLGMGAGESCRFSEWQPDAVVINLGTNDYFAFTSGTSWTDTDGHVHRMRMDSDGNLNPEDTGKFTDAVYGFIKTVRKNNPNSYILWCYGMIGRQLLPFIEKAVGDYRRDTGDERVSFLLLPDTGDGLVGANNHPNAAHHKLAADALAGALRKILPGIDTVSKNN